jgi:hypothetical protein
MTLETASELFIAMLQSRSSASLEISPRGSRAAAAALARDAP